ncbi:hypothetical protein [Aureimonas psammosilenae]|uniref:hypothetical protein n=1 Tax=Aureimonas psammosilenae TaxID=2495496 RepID=UPI001260B4FA|nr:hypothetical protein [Aureimonas psammosilenae]
MKSYTGLLAVASLSVSSILGAGWTGAAMAQEATPAAIAAPPAAPSAAPVSQAPAVSATPDATAAPQGEGAATTAAAPNGEGQVMASCFLPPAGASMAEVDAFLANPQDLVSRWGTDNVTLSNKVRSLAGSDKRAIDALIALSKEVSVDRAGAIGAGLGRAAFGCVRTSPEYAALIQAKVAELATAPLMTAFVAASNDMQVAALGAGGGGGGAAAAGLTGSGNAGPFSAGLGGDEVVPTTVETYSLSGGRSISVDNDGDNDTVRIIVIRDGDDGCDASISPFCVN